MADRGRCGNDLHPNRSIREQHLANVRQSHESRMLSISKGKGVVDHRLEEKYIKVYDGQQQAAPRRKSQAQHPRLTLSSNQFADDALSLTADDKDDADLERNIAVVSAASSGAIPSPVCVVVGGGRDAAPDGDDDEGREEEEDDDDEEERPVLQQRKKSGRPRSAPVFRGRSALQRAARQKSIDRENAFLMERMKRVFTHGKPLWSSEFGTRHAIKVDHLEVLRPKELREPLFGVNTSGGRIRPVSSAGARRVQQLTQPVRGGGSSSSSNNNNNNISNNNNNSSSSAFPPTSSSADRSGALEYSDDFLDGDDGFAPSSLPSSAGGGPAVDPLDGSLAFIKNLDNDDDDEGNHQLEASAVSFTLPDGHGHGRPSESAGGRAMRPKSAVVSSPGVASFLRPGSSRPSSSGGNNGSGGNINSNNLPPRPSTSTPASRRPSAVSICRPTSATDTEPPRRQSVVVSLTGLSRLRASERIIVENEKIVKNISKIMKNGIGVAASSTSTSRPSSAHPSSSPGVYALNASNPSSTPGFAGVVVVAPRPRPSSARVGSGSGSGSHQRGGGGGGGAVYYPVPGGGLSDFPIPPYDPFPAPSLSALARARLHPESDHVWAYAEADRFEVENESAIRLWEESLARKVEAVATAKSLPKTAKIEKYITPMQRDAKERERFRQEAIATRIADEKAEEEAAAKATADAARKVAEEKLMEKVAEKAMVRARGISLAASKFNSVLVRNEEKRKQVQVELRSIASIASLEVMRFMQKSRTESHDALDGKDMWEVAEEIKKSRNMEIIRMTLLNEKQDEAINAQVDLAAMRNPDSKHGKSMKVPKDYEKQAFAVLNLFGVDIEPPPSLLRGPSHLQRMASHIDITGGHRGGKTSWGQDYLFEDYNFNMKYDIEDEVKIAGQKRNIEVELVIEVISVDTIEVRVVGNNQLVDGVGDMTIGTLSFTQKVPSLVIGEREAGMHYAKMLASRLIVSKHATKRPTVVAVDVHEHPEVGSSDKPLSPKKRAQEEARLKAEKAKRAKRNSVHAPVAAPVVKVGWYLKTEVAADSII